MGNILFSFLKILFRKQRKYEYGDPSINSNSTEFEVDNWIISQFVINNLVPVVDIEPFPVNEQVLMVAAVCRIKPTHIIEWGTNIGKSSRIFYETCRAFGLDSEIHSIDLPDNMEHIEHPKENRGLLVRGIKEVNLHLGDGLENALQIVSNSKKDDIRPLFFIDGDHSYKSVKRELEGVIKSVPQSNILLHDTFYQSEESGYNVGPHKAVVDVLAGMPSRYKIISQNIGLPGMTLLWQD